MAILYPISAPPIVPSNERITLRNLQGQMKSPHTGHKTIVDNFSEWEVTLDFPAQRRGSTLHKAFIAWVDSLHGALGSFTYRPYGSGKAVAAQLRTTGFAYATEINLTGWTPNGATNLTAGDYFTLAGCLHRVVIAPTNANASGDATISFVPPLRADRAAGTLTNFATPSVTLRLETDDEVSGSTVMTDVHAVYCQSITAREVI